MTPLVFAAILFLVLLFGGVGYVLLRLGNPSLTDSPWFWGLVFCGIAFAGLLGIGQKYYGREARLEGQLEARTEIHRRQIAQRSGEQPTRDAAEDRDAPEQPELLATLTPLTVLAAIGTAVSAFMLRRELQKAARKTEAERNQRPRSVRNKSRKR